MEENSDSKCIECDFGYKLNLETHCEPMVSNCAIMSTVSDD